MSRAERVYNALIGHGVDLEFRLGRFDEVRTRVADLLPHVRRLRARLATVASGRGPTLGGLAAASPHVLGWPITVWALRLVRRIGLIAVDDGAVVCRACETVRRMAHRAGAHLYDVGWDDRALARRGAGPDVSARAAARADGDRPGGEHWQDVYDTYRRGCWYDMCRAMTAAVAAVCRPEACTAVPRPYRIGPLGQAFLTLPADAARLVPAGGSAETVKVCVSRAELTGLFGLDAAVDLVDGGVCWPT